MKLDAARKKSEHSPLWPNFVGSELAPATAKRELEKNVFSAASMLILEDDMENYMLKVAVEVVGIA